jgi:hypothetical protein
VASGRLKSGGDFQFTVEIKSNVNVSSAVLEIKLNTRDGSPLGTAFSQDIGPLVQGADYRFDAEICDPGMSPGRYSCSFVLVVGGRTPVDAVLDVMRFDFEAPDRFPMAHHTWNPDWGSLRLSMQNRVSRLAH